MSIGGRRAIRAKGTFPDLSNSCCLPGRAGGPLNPLADRVVHRRGPTTGVAEKAARHHLRASPPRRATRTILIPEAAICCAHSLPIPAEAPVTSAQGPNLFYRARLSSFRSVLPA